jgi:hypothetical protein
VKKTKKKSVVVAVVVVQEDLALHLKQVTWQHLQHHYLQVLDSL